jgi:hypothetical protein
MNVNPLLILCHKQAAIILFQVSMQQALWGGGQHGEDRRMLYIMLSKRKEDHGSLIHLFKIRADFVTVNIRIYSFSALFLFVGII